MHLRFLFNTVRFVLHVALEYAFILSDSPWTNSYHSALSVFLLIGV